jgi:hypothetical protein
MVQLCIRCDPVPGKQDELDRFLTEQKKQYWLKQPGVKGFHIYGDELMGWPERTIVIEVDDMGALQRALESPEHGVVRQAFFGLTSRNESQVQHEIG